MQQIISNAGQGHCFMAMNVSVKIKIIFFNKHNLSVTSNINCILHADLINVGYLTEYVFIR